MSVHLHRARQWTACMLSAAALSPLAFGFGSGLPTPLGGPSEATGRVTLEGCPVSDMILCLDLQGHHTAFARVGDDGTFRISSMTRLGTGAQPGRYRAHLFTHKDGPYLPSKYTDPATSGIEIEIASGWNDFRIDLH